MSINMNNKEFKKIFSEFAKANNFKHLFGGWIKESPECIIVLFLQKSNFADYFELNIKIFIKGIFGNTYLINKDLVKNQVGDIFLRPPNNYKEVFDFNNLIYDVDRIEKLKNLFVEFLNPFIEKAEFRKGLNELEEQKKIFLLPAIKNELMKM